MRKEKSKFDLLIKLSICAAITVITIVLTHDFIFDFTPLRELELKHIDERFVKRGQIVLGDSADVVILEITQNTYDGIPAPYNSWPWPRSIFARVIENLNEAGVKAIGIDIVMSNEDKFSPRNDSLMAAAIEKYGNVVVAGKINIQQGTVAPGSEGEIHGYEVQRLQEDYQNIFYDADSSVGIVQVVADNDGIHRRYMPFMLSASNERVPTFGFAVLNQFYDLPSTKTAQITDNYFLLADNKIPKYDEISMLINFYGPDRTFPHYDLLDVLDDREFNTTDEIDYETPINTWDDPDFGLKYSGIFEDKVVLIGSTMPEDKDIMPISFGVGEKKGDNWIYGVELHANAVQNILDDFYITKISLLEEIIIVLILTLITFFATSFVRDIKSKFGLLLEAGNVIIAGIIVVALYLVSLYLFAEYNYLFVLVSPAFAVALGYFGSTAYYYVMERRQKAMIKNMFTQYVDTSVVNQLIEHPDQLKLGGDKSDLTVFFSDIESFSTFSENLEPEVLLSALNDYLSEMTKIVFDNQGTLDKYIGDAVMAFWGAPVITEKHAYLACKTAIEQQSKMRELQKEWREAKHPIFKMRVGINTGEVIVGNIGGSSRFDYTVIGDNVNIASRLEGANKQYGTGIIISEFTHRMIKDQFITRELDYLVVKGRTKPIKIYELVAENDSDIDEDRVISIDMFHKGLEYYRDRNFERARDTFANVLSLNPADSPAERFMMRCEIYIDNPPDDAWDGVFRMTTK